ncbi:o-succinylbenzoate synthase, partial [Leptolyngbya sp. FACHB-36]|uniref:o-succinylbenzoate synthase n=1 Tax=Leptolyngbya sp. FACHB-36 TaxID=2692808 RepID=UPI001681AC5D
RLLPAGEAALSAWKMLHQQGFRTLKWKIGVEPIAQELVVFEHLIQALPVVNLRLDANGGLSLNEAEQWLERCDRLNATERSVQVEYLEQPLPPHQFTTMQSLSDRYRTSIALDESVATLPQLCTHYDQGWSGIFVIKPAIAGSPIRLRQFCRSRSIDAVFSTVFETAIGRQAGLRLAADLGRDRAVGYEGTFDEFDYFQEEKWNEELESIGGSEPTTIG